MAALGRKLRRRGAGRKPAPRRSARATEVLAKLAAGESPRRSTPKAPTEPGVPPGHGERAPKLAKWGGDPGATKPPKPAKIRKW